MSRHVRAIPSATYTAPWFNAAGATNARLRSLPHEVFNTLSPRGREIAFGLARKQGESTKIKWSPDWDVAAGIGGGGQSNASHKGIRVSRL